MQNLIAQPTDELALRQERMEQIKTLPPGVAIDLGYLYLVADTEVEDGQVKESALQGIRRFREYFAAFNPSTREGLYLTELGTAAISYSRGIQRERRLYEEAKAEAHERKAIRTSTFVITATRAGFLRGGMKILTIGGLAFWLTKAIFDWSPKLHDKPGETAAFAMTAAAILIGIWQQMGQIRRYQREIFDRYEVEVRSAKQRQVEGMEAEFDLAMQLANQAWIKLFQGTAPPPVDTRKTFVYAVMRLHLDGQDQILRGTKDAETVAAPRARFWTRIFAPFRMRQQR